MKRTFLVTQMIVFAMCLSGCRGSEGLKRKKGLRYEAETRSWEAAIRARGGNGMWLVTRGYHVGDDMVAVATNSRVSHASVLDLDRGQVIEAVGRGVVVTDLGRFLRDAHLMHLLQPHGWSEERGAEAVARARSRVGSGYDFLGIAGVPTSSRFYCSELAVWSMGLKVNRVGPHHVLHPREMNEYAEVLFSSGARDGKTDFRDTVEPDRE